MMKLLLIEGQPGSGKSTFASKICNDFEKMKILDFTKDYHL